MFLTNVLDEALVNYEYKLGFRVPSKTGNNWLFCKQAKMLLLNEAFLELLKWTPTVHPDQSEHHETLAQTHTVHLEKWKFFLLRYIFILSV